MNNKTNIVRQRSSPIPIPVRNEQIANYDLIDNSFQVGSPPKTPRFNLINKSLHLKNIDYTSAEVDQREHNHKDTSKDFSLSLSRSFSYSWNALKVDPQMVALHAKLSLTFFL